MKRLLALFLSLVLMLCAAVPAYATGDGNFDGGGGGMGSGTSTNYWNPGMDGVRISVVNVDSHAVVGNTIDWSNQNPSTNMIHFGKVSKLSYNSGRALSPVVGGYVCVRPAQSLPRIISTGDYPASIAAIRSYFTDEQVIRAIAGYVGIDFDTLIAGDYKIVVEPIAYFVYGGAYYAMTATEAALYDQKVNGNLRSKMDRSPIRICRWPSSLKKQIWAIPHGLAAPTARSATIRSSRPSASESSASTVSWSRPM